MKIPYLSRWINNYGSPKPKKPKFFIDKEITFKIGQQESSVEIPTLLNVSAFEIVFPSGLTYMFGDDRIEEESKEVKVKRDPEIKICLPDISDKNMTVPISLGFDSNPKKAYIYDTLITIGVPLAMFLIMIIMSLRYISTINMLLFMTYGITTAYLSVSTIKFYRKQRAFWKNVQVHTKDGETLK